MAFGVYIPALIDGLGLAADGSAITNAGGHVHNGSEVTLTQTDATIIARTDIPFWTNGTTAVAVTYADFLARTNGNNKQIDRWEKDTECVTAESVLYPEAYEEDMEWYSKGINWTNDLTCGAGWVEPLQDAEGIVYDTDGYPIFVQP